MPSPRRRSRSGEASNPGCRSIPLGITPQHTSGRRLPIVRSNRRSRGTRTASRISTSAPVRGCVQRTLAEAEVEARLDRHGLGWIEATDEWGPCTGKARTLRDTTLDRLRD